MDESARYEIRVAEYIDERLPKWFEGLEIAHTASGETLLRGEMADQPALFGALGRVRDLGLTLISVQRLEPIIVEPYLSEIEWNLNEASNEGR